MPISIRLVAVPIAASSGNGEASWRAKWWTRKKAPSIPISSAATASSTDCLSASAAVCVCEPWRARPVAEAEEADALAMRRRCDVVAHRDRRRRRSLAGARAASGAQLLWTMKTLRLLCWATAPETLPSSTCLMPERPREPSAIRAASCSSAASTICAQTGPPSAIAVLGSRPRPRARSAPFVGHPGGASARRVDEHFHRLRLDRDAGGAGEGNPVELLGDDQDHDLAAGELGGDLVDRGVGAAGAVVGDQDRGEVGHRLGNLDEGAAGRRPLPSVPGRTVRTVALEFSISSPRRPSGAARPRRRRRSDAAARSPRPSSCPSAAAAASRRGSSPPAPPPRAARGGCRRRRS